MDEKKEGRNVSKKVTFQLKDLFAAFSLQNKTTK